MSNKTKNLETKRSDEEIYEIDGVFGDNERFISNDLRLKHMFSFVKNINSLPKQALDIGCGTGYFSNLIKKTFSDSEVYGLDISKKALSIARKQYPNIHFLEGDAELKLPFKDGSFDLVISGEHLEHLKDVDTYLLEIHRIMHSKGTLILTTPNLASWLNRALLLFGLQPFYLEPSLRQTLPILSYFGKTFPDDLNAPPSGHLRLYTLNMLKKLLSFYGFSLVEARGTSILQGAGLKQLDQFFSNIPSLAFGLVLKLEKK